MKLATLMGMAALLAAGMAGGSALAADMDCDAAWTLASPHGDAISKGTTTPYVINYTMVDSDADGKISAEEFKKGCAAGAVTAADAATTKDMGDGK
jgi:hypothetical protein